MATEGTTRHKQILGLQLKETTLYELRKDLEDYSDYSSYNPYVINENGRIVYADDWQVLKEASEDVKVIEVTKQYADEYLEHEISNGGIEDTFSRYDWRPIVAKLQVNKKGSSKVYDTQRVIVEVLYYCSYDHYSGGYDYECDIEVLGYMDSDLIIQRVSIKDQL